MAKKASRSAASTKKKTAKKTAKAGAKKAPARKKAPAKKAPTKKVAAKKAAAKKKTVSKKSAPAKKAPAKKPAAKKAPAKKAPSKKTTTKKKTSSTSKKSTEAAEAKKSAGGGPKFHSPFASSAGAAGRAAAAKLVAAAGLTGVRATGAAAEVADESYKRITKTPLSKKQLDEFRLILREKRNQLVGDVTSMENEALGSNSGALSRLSQHMADQGSDTFDQTLNLDLAASQRGLLKEIDAALERIDARTYGVCELLGKPIGIERLRNTPWARFSIEAARRLENNPHLLRQVGSDD